MNVGNIWQSNAEIFMDTRKKSNTIYLQDTKNLLEHTEVYEDACEDIDYSNLVVVPNTDITVVHGGTVSTAYSIKDKNPSCRVAMLDFADAKRPGGWVIEGAQTQEENMCRCTNLYETLVQEKCIKNYYEFNMECGIPDSENHYNEPYTDALIYAENVAIFKDDETYKSIPVRYVDVIVSPAPCGKCDALEDILMYRMEGILQVAYKHGVTHLVLGAWGCGAFMQSPKVVASCFARVLKKFPVFESVVFAIRPTINDGGKIIKDRIFMAFEKQFRAPLF